MGEPGAAAGGILGSVRRIGASLLALAENRLHLFALEFQSEQIKFIDLLLWLGVALALGGAGLILGAVAVALVLSASARLALLVILAVVFLGAAAGILWRVRRRLRTGPGPFNETLAEFEKDRACLHSKD